MRRPCRRAFRTTECSSNSLDALPIDSTRLRGIVRLRARVAEWASEQSGPQLSRLPFPIRDHQPRRVALLPIRSQLPGC